MNALLPIAAALQMQSTNAPPPQGDALFIAATGAWEILSGGPGSEDVSCDTEPMRIRIEADSRRYFVRHGDWSDTATILDHGLGWFHIAYDGEARLDRDGGTVSWYWVYASPDSFYWVRNDWLDTGDRTVMRVRCMNGQVG
mgnify:CR=1 FL=1